MSKRFCEGSFADGSIGAYRPEQLYPLLQSLLKAKGLHFLVAPFKAAGQVSRIP